MEHIAGPVGGDGVDPGNAQSRRHRPLHLGHGLCLADRHPGGKAAVIVIIGVADRIGLVRFPPHADEGNGQHRAEAAGIERALHAGAVGHRHRNGDGPHRLRLAVDQVAGGVGGVELQLEHGEMLCRRHRVRPGDILVEPQRHQRRAGQPHAHHIDLAGNGDVHLPEARRAVPREVRIADDQPAPALGRFRAERPAIAAPADVALAGQAPVLRHGGGSFAGGGGIDDIGRHRQAARQQHLLFGQPQQIVQGDRPQPRLAPARFGCARTNIAQPPVIARDIARQQRTLVRRARRPALLQRRQVYERAKEHVRRQVVDLVEPQHGGFLRAEKARTFAGDGREFLRQHAQIVLGIGIAHAIARAAPVRRADVRNAIAGAGDGGAVARPLGQCHATAKSRCRNAGKNESAHVDPPLMFGLSLIARCGRGNCRRQKPPHMPRHEQ